jgi:hypothetical protein
MDDSVTIVNIHRLRIGIVHERAFHEGKTPGTKKTSMGEVSTREAAWSVQQTREAPGSYPAFPMSSFSTSGLGSVEMIHTSGLRWKMP